MRARIDIPSWARQILSDFTDMDRNPSDVEPDVDHMELDLPDDVYFEYAFRDGEGNVRADPGNPVRGSNPWYREVSVLTGPQYRSNRYAHLPDDAADGELERLRLESTFTSGIRRVNVYTPKGCQGEELPLVLVHDGTAFMRLAGLPRVLEALLDEDVIRPTRLAFVEPVDRQREYGFDEGYRRFTEEELLPDLLARYPFNGELYAWGASLGGLMSATLALRNPERFRGIVTFSGAFLGSPEDRDFYRSRESWVLQQLEALGRPPFDWYLETGTIEWLTNVNRRVARALEESGARHRLRERNAGHNWTNWRNGLADALTFHLRT